MMEMMIIACFVVFGMMGPDVLGVPLGNGEDLSEKTPYHHFSTYPTKVISYQPNPLNYTLNYTQRPTYTNYSTIHTNSNYTWSSNTSGLPKTYSMYNISSLNYLPRIHSAKSLSLEPDSTNSSSHNHFNHHDNDEILEEHYTFGTYDVIHRIHNHELNEKSSHSKQQTPPDHPHSDTDYFFKPSSASSGSSSGSGLSSRPSSGPPSVQPSGYGTGTYNNIPSYSSEAVDEADIRTEPYRRHEEGDDHMSGYQPPPYLMNYLKNVKSPASVWSSGWIPIDDGNTVEKRTVWFNKDDRRRI